MPHPIRPNSLAVSSGEYPIGMVGDDSDIGRGWTWVLHPNGLPISIAGRAESQEEGLSLLGEQWRTHLDYLGLEFGADGTAPKINYEPTADKHFWLKLGEARLGSILLINPGQRFGPLYRWEVADHPAQENRIGYAEDLEMALVGAQSGWQAWVEWAGLKAK